LQNLKILSAPLTHSFTDHSRKARDEAAHGQHFTTQEKTHWWDVPLGNLKMKYGSIKSAETRTDGISA